MKLYEYDGTDGWLVGWYEADVPRPNSTEIAPPSPVSQARWVGGAWTIDPTRDQRQAINETAERSRRQQVISALRTYDPSTATAADVRVTLAAVIAYLNATT